MILLSLFVRYSVVEFLSIISHYTNYFNKIATDHVKSPTTAGLKVNGLKPANLQRLGIVETEPHPYFQIFEFPIIGKIAASAYSIKRFTRLERI